MLPYIGQMAALGTAFLWSISAVAVTSAGRRIGAFTTNGYRIIVGCLLLTVIHLMIFGRVWPDASGNQFIMLGASGVIGLIVGDAFLFQSYVDIGPRIALLIFNTNPFITAFIASFALGERLGGRGWIGMIVTLAGVVWVLYEENRGRKEGASKRYARGIVFAILAAVCQSTGYVLAKPAMLGPDGLPTLSATLIRLAIALIGFLIIAMVKRDFFRLGTIARNRKIIIFLLVGSTLGPLGIWMSLIALKYVSAAVAATITATIPVMILPTVMIAHKEKVSWRAAIGAVIAVIGVAVLFNVR